MRNLSGTRYEFRGIVYPHAECTELPDNYAEKRRAALEDMRKFCREAVAAGRSTWGAVDCGFHLHLPGACAAYYAAGIAVAAIVSRSQS